MRNIYAPIRIVYFLYKWIFLNYALRIMHKQLIPIIPKATDIIVCYPNLLCSIRILIVVLY